MGDSADGVLGLRGEGRDVMYVVCIPCIVLIIENCSSIEVCTVFYYHKAMVRALVNSLLLIMLYYCSFMVNLFALNKAFKQNRVSWAYTTPASPGKMASGQQFAFSGTGYKEGTARALAGLRILQVAHLY